MENDQQKRGSQTYMPSEADFQETLKRRNQRGLFGRLFYYFSIIIAILALVTLFGNVINQAFGSIVVANEIEPQELTDGNRPLSELNAFELAAIMGEREPNRIIVLLRENHSSVSSDIFLNATLSEIIPNGEYPEGYADRTINEIRDLEEETRNDVLAEFLALNVPRGQIENYVLEEVVEQQILDAWTLGDAIFNWEPSPGEQTRIETIPQEISTLQDEIATLEADIATINEQVSAIRAEGGDDDRIRELNAEARTLDSEIDALEAEIENLNKELDSLIRGHVMTQLERIRNEGYPNAVPPVDPIPDATAVRYHSWLSGKFLTTPMSSTPAQAGIRTAILGSIYMMVIVIIVSLPIGVGTAIYLEEYATDSFINRVIETNVRNLAGVPSIIYGLLGLSIFVRVLAPVMSGNLLGVDADPPRDEQVVNSIEDAIDVNFLLEEDERGRLNYVGIEENDLLTEAQANDLFATFRRLGTKGFNNPYGEISTERAATSVWSALYGETIDVENIDNPTRLQPDMVSADFEAVDLSFDEFIALTTNLKQFANLTVGGRTLLSAALTLTLLILPIIIINSQEALRAVPYEFREASYGLGATKWQTIWRTVLPTAVPQIMTGMILSISRAVGETAPLIVVGASTFILSDPSGPFSNFTVLPIQIYSWTARPQEQFQFIAAAAIIVLLTLVISLNALAIFLRNRYSIRY